MKKLASFLLAAFVILFLVASPALIAGGVHKNVYTIQEAEQRAKYRGTLTVWHVVSFRTGSGSGVSLLQTRATNFERSNPYVFIEVIGMTPEEYQERIARGESPDILSYPMGMFSDASMFADLPEAENLLPLFADCGKDGGAFKSYPYMADIYQLLCNGEIFFEAGLSLPFADDSALSQLLEMILDLKNREGIQPLTLWEDSCASLPLRSTVLSAEGLPGDNEAFITGQAAMTLCPRSYYRRLDDDQRANSLNIYSYGAGYATDLVQMIGVLQSDDPAKIAMCADFCSSMLSRSVQAKLASLEMLPVVERVSAVYDEAIFGDLQKQGYVPNTFALAAGNF